MTRLKLPPNDVQQICSLKRGLLQRILDVVIRTEQVFVQFLGNCRTIYNIQRVTINTGYLQVVRDYECMNKMLSERVNAIEME